MKRLHLILIAVILLLTILCIKQTYLIHQQEQNYLISTNRLLHYIEELQKQNKEERYEIIVEEETDPRVLLEHYSIVYDIDPHLAVAISRAETGNWTSSIFNNNNNFGGMRGRDGWYTFDNRREGAEALCKLLAKYKERGQVTIEEIATTYCPNGQGEWIKLVTTIYNEEVQ